MKNWDYAEMAKEAKKLGGPEKYADFLVRSGRNDMVPWIILVSLISAGVGACGSYRIQKLIRHIKAKNEAKKKKVENVKQELIKNLKEFEEDNSEQKWKEDYKDE